MSAPTALLFGVSGQDGAYLSRLLLGKGYAVHGVSRDATRQPFARLHTLGIRDAITMHTCAMRDAEELRRLVDSVEPDEIYNLTGLTSVAQSFAEPEVAKESIAGSQHRLLDVVRDSGARTRLYQSASTDCFGDLPHGAAADEQTPFAPRSPYATAKADAYRITKEYRERFGLYAVSGIVGNHESPLRGSEFVTAKIVAAAAAIARGNGNGALRLGNLSASRDWGYAPEYVEAMWLMLQQAQPADYVIATGESHTVEELVAATFAAFDLDHREHVVADGALLRPTDIQFSRGNPALIRDRLGWQARTRFADLVHVLVHHARNGGSP